MAHLWHEHDGQWTAMSMEDVDQVGFDGCRWLPTDATLTDSGLVAALVRATGSGPDAPWVLVAATAAGPGVQVNGQPLALGLRVLRDRDELSAGGASWFFSTETLPTIVPFPGPAGAACPRCKIGIDPGQPVVRCVGCRVVYHQSEERPCWLYGEACALCGRPTALDQGYAWTPAEL
jgi:hypothetical protein